MERLLKYMQYFKFYKSSQGTARVRYKLNDVGQQRRTKSNYFKLMTFKNIGDAKSGEMDTFDELKSVKIGPHYTALVQSGKSQQKKDITSPLKWHEKKQGLTQWRANITKMHENLTKDQNNQNKFKWNNNRSKLTQWRSKSVQKPNTIPTSIPTVLVSSEPLRNTNISDNILTKDFANTPLSVLEYPKKFEESTLQKCVKQTPQATMPKLLNTHSNNYKITVIVQSPDPAEPTNDVKVQPSANTEPSKPADDDIMKYSLQDEFEKPVTYFSPFLTDQGVSCAYRRPPIFSLTPATRHMQSFLGQVALAGVSSPYSSFENSERLYMKSLKSYWENTCGKKDYSSQGYDKDNTIKDSENKSLNVDEVALQEQNTERVPPKNIPKVRVIKADNLDPESNVKTRVFRKVGSSWKSEPYIPGQKRTKEEVKYSFPKERDDLTLGIAHFTAVIPRRKSEPLKEEFTQLKYTFPAKLKRKAFRLKPNKKIPLEAKKSNTKSVSLPKKTESKTIGTANPIAADNPIVVDNPTAITNPTAATVDLTKPIIGNKTQENIELNGGMKTASISESNKANLSIPSNPNAKLPLNNPISEFGSKKKLQQNKCSVDLPSKELDQNSKMLVLEAGSKQQTLQNDKSNNPVYSEKHGLDSKLSCNIPESEDKEKLQYNKFNMGIKTLSENTDPGLKTFFYNPFSGATDLKSFINEKFKNKSQVFERSDITPLSEQATTIKKVNKVNDSKDSTIENLHIANPVEKVVDSNKFNIENTIVADEAKVVKNTNISETENLPVHFKRNVHSSNSIMDNLQASKNQFTMNMTELLSKNCVPNTKEQISTPVIEALHSAITNGGETSYHIKSEDGLQATIPCDINMCMNPSNEATCCTANAPSRRDRPPPCTPSKRPSPMSEFFSSSHFWIRNAGFVNVLLLLLGISYATQTLAKPTPEELEIEKQEKQIELDKQKYERRCRRKSVEGCPEKKCCQKKGGKEVKKADKDTAKPANKEVKEAAKMAN